MILPSQHTTPIIAIGTLNPAKIDAVLEVTSQIWPHVELKPVAVDSGVSEMPMDDMEGMSGALRRARAALAATHAHYGIGLEGAVQESPTPIGASVMFLSNWVAIVDRNGQESLANGGAIPLPECIARKLRAGGELGPIIDQLSGQVNSKQHQGAAGFLTKGLVPRQAAFAMAVAFALAPFVSPELYLTMETSTKT